MSAQLICVLKRIRVDCVTKKNELIYRVNSDSRRCDA